MSKLLKNQKGISLITLILILIIIIIAVFLFFAISNNSQDDMSKDISLNNSSISAETYGLNEELNLYGSDGGKGSISITGISETSERDNYAAENYSQVFIIDYTYKNISSSDSMYISGSNFKIIDEEGEIGGECFISHTFPETITAGTTCRAQMVFGVRNRSTKVKLQYWSSISSQQPSAIFELNV